MILRGVDTVILIILDKVRCQETERNIPSPRFIQTIKRHLVTDFEIKSARNILGEIERRNIYPNDLINTGSQITTCNCVTEVLLTFEASMNIVCGETWSIASVMSML